MLNYSDVKIGSAYKQWQDGKCMTLTFCVTEDCNLACKYCYMVGKNSKRKMSFEVAKEIVDYVLNDKYLCREDAVVWDFIGGEPLLEIDMISKLCDYIVAKMYITNHKWFNKYRFSFSTNGTLYGEPAVQKFINRHRGHVWFSMSVDGTKEKHNLSRIRKDGTGSYDDVAKNIPLWLKQFPNAATKSTFSHDDLPYLKDSIIHLWNLGVKYVMANIVYEDVWEDGDDMIYESQLKELADYVLDNHLWDQYGVAFFSPTVGLPVDQECLATNRCGAGDKSIAFDCDGNFYPCIRFLEMCFSNHKKIVVGNLKDGININYLRSFITLNWKNQSNSECNNCSVGKGCGWCVAYNFEKSEKDTIFERSIAICKMHKANARANKYFWDRFEMVTGRTSQLTFMKSNTPNASYLKYINFITSDGITPHCGYISKNDVNNHMSNAVIDKGLAFCYEYNLIPMFLGKCNHNLDANNKMHFNLLSSRETIAQHNVISIYDSVIDNVVADSGVAILLINLSNLNEVFELCQKLALSKTRVNLFIQDIEKWKENDYNIYEKQVRKIGDLIIDGFKKNKKFNINIISDFFDKNHSKECGAGITTISLAPNGKFYLCPAFYFDDPENFIGTLDDGIVDIDKKFLSRNDSPVCAMCDSNNCTRCLFINKKMTRELHIPPINYCRVNTINRNVAKDVKEYMLDKGLMVKKHLSNKDSC